MIRRLLIAFAALLAPVAAWAAEGGRGWHEASSRHFVVYAEGTAENARKLAERLERFDGALRKIRNLPDPPLGPANRLTVVQLDDQGDIARLAGRSDVAGFYAGRASGSYAFVPRRVGDGSRFDMSADAVLFHEYAHHFMLANYPGAFPAWFVEGFAEFHATAKFEEDGSLHLGQPAYYRGYGLLAGKPLPLEAMLTGDFGRLTDQQLDALYGRGWLLLHYLTFEPARRGQLAAYLGAVGRGVRAGDAARTAFGDLRKLDRDLDRYLGKRLSYWTFTSTAIPTPEVAVRRLSPAEAAIMPVRIRSKRGVDAKEGAKVVAAARKVAARHPADGLVQVTLAEAEYDVGEYARAEAAADAALKLDPRHAEALIYKGRARMAALAKLGGDPAAWRGVRQLFTAANKLDPEDPEPLVLFYESFGAQGSKPTPNAVAGLNYALDLAPQDIGLRFTVARQHLVDGKGPEAKAALAPAAYAPHRGETATFARAIISKIDEGGPAAALTMADAQSAARSAAAPQAGR